MEHFWEFDKEEKQNWLNWLKCSLGLRCLEKRLERFTDKELGSFHQMLGDKIGRKPCVKKCNLKNWKSQQKQVSEVRNNIVHAESFQLKQEDWRDYLNRIRKLVEAVKHLPEFKSLSKDIDEIQNFHDRLMLPDDIAAQRIPAQDEKHLEDIHSSRPLCEVCSSWRASILANHTSPRGKVMWKNSKPDRWSQDKWEVAKVYMPDGHKNHNSIGDFDIAALLCLMKQCKHFKKFELGVFGEKVSEVRNNIMHAPRFELKTETLRDSFNRIRRLGKALGNHVPEFKSLSKDIDEIQNLHWRPIFPNDIAAQKSQAQDEKHLEDIVVDLIKHARAKHRLSQKGVNDFVAEVQQYQSSLMDYLKKQMEGVVKKHSGSTSGQFEKDAMDIFDNFSDPFAGVATTFRQNKVIKKQFSCLDAEEIPNARTICRKKRGVFDYVPLVKSLEPFLSQIILSMIEKRCREGFFHDIVDGALLKSHPLFSEKPHPLQIVRYMDEIEICNPLGSFASKNKLLMVYYTLGNINPKCRSKLAAIRLLAMARSADFRQSGLDVILNIIKEDMDALYSGVKMQTINGEKAIYGAVVSLCGDTLAQHELAGFKEGVGFPYSKSRHGECSFEDMQSHFNEDAYTQRTLEKHVRQCDEIENTDLLRNSLTTTYRINRRSKLVVFPAFNLIKQTPQDIMHVILEGIAPLEIKCVLNHLVQSGQIDLDSVNPAILGFPYSPLDVRDRPSLILSMIEKRPQRCREGFFHDIVDGALLKSHPLFSEKPHPLQIVRYMDEIEICNPLGSFASKNKLLMVYYTLGNINPKYRSKLAAIWLLSVPRVRTKHGEAAFSFSAPHIWNKVPESCRSAETLSSFKSRLKTFLFAAAFY